MFRGELLDRAPFVKRLHEPGFFRFRPGFASVGWQSVLSRFGFGHAFERSNGRIEGSHRIRMLIRAFGWIDFTGIRIDALGQLSAFMS